MKEKGFSIISTRLQPRGYPVLKCSRSMKEKGFGIISAMVSSVILIIGLLTLIRVFLASPIINARSDKVSRASTLAEQRIEEFRAMGYDSLVNLINAGSITGEETIEGITTVWTLPSVVPTNDMIEVNLQCKWKTPGNPDSSALQFTTIISYHE